MSARRTDKLQPASIISHLGVMVAVAAVMGILVAGLAIPFAGVAGIGARDVARSMEKIPADLEAEPLPQRTRLVSKDGSTLATLYDQNRVNVPLAKVAPIMRKAIISIEDYRFYQHGALDLKGTLRALVTNEVADGTVQGGSSITQQMVKMTLLNQADTERGEGRGHRADHGAQDPRAALRDRVRAEVLQGLDPGALPQHRLLRRRRPRHRGCLAPLLLQARVAAEPAARRRCSPAW